MQETSGAGAVDRSAPGPTYDDVWVVLPTYNEIGNLPGIAATILSAVPGASLLVVDDNSPDGTGRLADDMAGRDPHVHVLHRPRKQGLGRAYIDGFRVALERGAGRIVQMDADGSHDPAHLPALLEPLAGGAADLVIGSRYVRGGGVRDWGLGRRVVSRGGSTFARIVLGLPAHDLTGGFKAWRRETLGALPWGAVHSGGYVFQIETTYLAQRAGANIAEVPIIFVDRRVGASKMSRRIIAEALLVVLRLRWEELSDRRRARAGSGDAGAARIGMGASPRTPGVGDAGAATTFPSDSDAPAGPRARSDAADADAADADATAPSRDPA